MSPLWMPSATVSIGQVVLWGKKSLKFQTPKMTKVSFSLTLYIQFRLAESLPVRVSLELRLMETPF